MTRLVLASGSAVRAALLRGAGVPFTVTPADVDESMTKRALLAAGKGPRGIAEALAAEKAVAVAAATPALVLGADQTLDLGGVLLDKAGSVSEARERLRSMRGRPHVLHTAAALALGDTIVWRRIESPVLTVRDFSDAWLDGYLERKGEAILTSVGCYQLEDEGAQLFEAIDGDYFAVLGLPLLGLLEELRLRGVLDR